MLSWDDETVASRASAHPRPHLQAVPTVPQFSTHADAALDPGILARPESKADTAGRVQAVDKRIINGQTDVNQLVPFKYKWAWDKYLAGCANHWMPQEINMQRDIELQIGIDGISVITQA